MLAGLLLMIVEAVGGFITIMLLVRVVMRAMGISFIGQLGRFTLSMTNWLVQPLRHVLPSAGRIDSAALLLAWGVQALLVLIGFVLAGRDFGNPATIVAGVSLLGALELFRTALHLLVGVVILGAILSWVNPYSPIAPVVHRVSSPFLQPLRRFIPPIGGIDISPLVLLLLIQILLYVLHNLSSRSQYLLWM